MRSRSVVSALFLFYTLFLCMAGVVAQTYSYRAWKFYVAALACGIVAWVTEPADEDDPPCGGTCV